MGFSEVVLKLQRLVECPVKLEIHSWSDGWWWSKMIKDCYGSIMWYRETQESDMCLQYHPVRKHGSIANPLWMEGLIWFNGKTSINGKWFIAMFDYWRVSCLWVQASRGHPRMEYVAALMSLEWWELDGDNGGSILWLIISGVEHGQEDRKIGGWTFQVHDSYHLSRYMEQLRMSMSCYCFLP